MLIVMNKMLVMEPSHHNNTQKIISKIATCGMIMQCRNPDYTRQKLHVLFSTSEEVSFDV